MSAEAARVQRPRLTGLLRRLRRMRWRHRFRFRFRHRRRHRRRARRGLGWLGFLR